MSNEPRKIITPDMVDPLIQQQMAAASNQQADLFNMHFGVASTIYVRLIAANKNLNEAGMRKLATLSTDAASVFLLKYGMKVRIRDPGKDDKPDPAEAKANGYTDQD